MSRNSKSATIWAGLAIALLAAVAPVARADYAVLQSGQRIHVTSYEVVGDTVRLTMTGGTLEIPADALLRIDPEDTFSPVKVKLLDVPFANLIATAAQMHGVAPELVERDCRGIKFQSQRRFLEIRAWIDAIDARNGSAVWGHQCVRSRAEYRRGNALPEGIVVEVQGRPETDFGCL